MCKENRSDDNTTLDNSFFSDHEDDDIVGENNSIVTHKIERTVLMAHIRSLTDQPTDEACITLAMALKIVDFVHFLNHRMAVSLDAANNLIHKWYKVNTNEKVVIPFNQRKKSMDEILQLLQADCDLDSVIIK